jgi:hypothetical protein
MEKGEHEKEKGGAGSSGSSGAPGGSSGRGY